MNQEDKPHIIKGKKDIDFFTDWLKKSEIVESLGFKYYSEIQYSEMKEKVRLSTLEEVDEICREFAFNQELDMVERSGVLHIIGELRKLKQRGKE